MEIAELLAALRREGELVAVAAERAGLDAAVPSCPDWAVRDLVRHAGGVHRWATSIVATGVQDPRTLTESEFFTDPPDGELLDWFRAGHRGLVAALTDADPDLDCWSFLRAPSPLAFWTRRQAHETTMHRVDAELAGGAVGPIDATFAVDGLAELLEGFLVRKRGRLVADPPRTLAVHAEDGRDGPAHWWFHIGPDGRRVERADRPADCVLTGPAADLYRLLWNRAAPDTIRHTGDPAVLDLWRSTAQVRWS